MTKNKTRRLYPFLDVCKYAESTERNIKEWFEWNSKRFRKTRALCCLIIANEPLWSPQFSAQINCTKSESESEYHNIDSIQRALIVLVIFSRIYLTNVETEFRFSIKWVYIWNFDIVQVGQMSGVPIYAIMWHRFCLNKIRADARCCKLSNVCDVESIKIRCSILSFEFTFKILVRYQVSQIMQCTWRGEH